MKVLIWCLCIFANVLITTLIKEEGVILGAIPTMVLYFATIWPAFALCKKYDKEKANKAMRKTSFADNPKSTITAAGQPFEYLPVPKDGWRCSCGRTHARYERTCICGKSKLENKTHSQADVILSETTDQVLFCRKCGAKLLANSQFCSKCGTKIIET